MVLRYALVLVTVSAALLIADSRYSIAQSEFEISEIQAQQAPPAEPPAPALDGSPVSSEELGYQALEQGPVHEAFAAPMDSDPTDGVPVIDKAPPKAVDEQPPKAGPEAEAMKWIPGYWAWSDDDGDYVWVSGLWRKIPPGRTWTPGNWVEPKSGHYRWASGYWSVARTSADSANYLPIPPKSIDNGPSIPPPHEDDFWVPGSWEYANGDYHWRSGFWSLPQGDWVWQPACYVYRPQGYVWVDGYWDFLPPNRGQLYAPVIFHDPIYLQPNYVYRPRYPLASASSLLLNLFVRRGYPCYYYGNYYGSSYASLGYRPWFNVGFGYGYSAPWLSNYDRTYRKSGINFVASMRRYENHWRNESNRIHSQHAGGKRSATEGTWNVSAEPPSGERSRRSMDAFVRSDVGRVAHIRSDHSPLGNSGRKLSIPSSDISRSTERSNPPSSFRKSSPSSKFATGADGSDSIPAINSREFSRSDIRRSTISGSTIGNSPNPYSGSPNRRSFDSSATSQLDPSSSSNVRSPGSFRSIQPTGSPSSNFRSQGPSPSFRGGGTPAMSRTNSPSFSRGGSPSMSRTITPSLGGAGSPAMSRTRSPSFSAGRSPAMSQGNSPSIGGGGRGSANFSGGPGPGRNRSGGNSPSGSGGPRGRGSGKK